MVGIARRPVESSRPWHAKRLCGLSSALRTLTLAVRNKAWLNRFLVSFGHVERGGRTRDELPGWHVRGHLMAPPRLFRTVLCPRTTVELPGTSACNPSAQTVPRYAVREGNSIFPMCASPHWP